MAVIVRRPKRVRYASACSRQGRLPRLNSDRVSVSSTTGSAVIVLAIFPHELLGQCGEIGLGKIGETCRCQCQNLAGMGRNIDILAVVSAQKRDDLPLEAATAPTGICGNFFTQGTWKTDSSTVGCLRGSSERRGQHNLKSTRLVRCVQGCPCRPGHLRDRTAPAQLRPPRRSLQPPAPSPHVAQRSGERVGVRGNPSRRATIAAAEEPKRWTSKKIHHVGDVWFLGSPAAPAGASHNAPTRRAQTTTRAPRVGGRCPACEFGRESPSTATAPRRPSLAASAPASGDHGIVVVVAWGDRLGRQAHLSDEGC